MSAILYVLMHETGERFKLGQATHTGADFARYHTLLQGIDVEASAALRFADEQKAAEFHTTVATLLNQWDITGSVADGSNEGHWYAAEGNLALHRFLADGAAGLKYEVLPINTYYANKGELPDLQAPFAVSVEDILNEPAAAPVTLGALDVGAVEHLLSQATAAMHSLRAVCGDNLALLPQVSQPGRFELIGIFGAENFTTAMAALGTLESDAHQVLFTDHVLSEIKRVRTQIDWAFCLKVAPCTASEQLSAGVPSEVALKVRRAFAATDFQIPGWGLPPTQPGLLEGVRQTYFRTEDAGYPDAAAG